MDGLTSESAAARLELPSGDPPAIAYYIAALRETFEETGILLGTRDDGSSPPPAADDPSMARLRDALMEGRIDFAGVLRRIECRLTGADLSYFGHWITPRRQPRRFDTRFFAARVDPATRPKVDSREMTEALWVAPAAALEQHADGALPMIRPTLWALERLEPCGEADEAIRTLTNERVATILPDD